VADRTGLGAPGARRDPGTLRIGSLAGVDVLVRSSWLLIAVVIAVMVAPALERVAPELGGLRYVAGLAFAVLLTLSLLVHEMSHALMAKRFGIPVRSITLHFIGGVTAIDGEPRSPKEELGVSVVGPLTSLALAGLAFALFQVTPAGLLSFVVGALAGANLVVGVLNLVPGMPLDGGRVLRAGVWAVTGDPHRATLVSGWAGRVVAVLVLLYPVALPVVTGVQVSVFDVMLAGVLAWFLWTAASAAVVSAKVRARLPALQARRLARRTVTVPASTPLAEAVRRAREMQAGAIVTLDHSGEPSGVVSEAALQATPDDRRPWLPVSRVARTLDEGLTLPADVSGEALVRALQRAPATEYLLLEPDGRIYGVLSTADVDRAFSATARS
jgi:Zn-dependent protease